MVTEIGKERAVAAYTILNQEEVKDVQKAKAKLGSDFDLAIVMRLVGQEEQTRWVPGSYPTYYGSFYGYYGYAGPMVYDPGYLTTDTIVRVETNIYTLPDEKLVYSALSETFNPSSAPKVVKEIGQIIRGDLRTKGLIP